LKLFLEPWRCPNVQEMQVHYAKRRALGEVGYAGDLLWLQGLLGWDGRATRCYRKSKGSGYARKHGMNLRAGHLGIHDLAV
jgi:hypothetical protein